MPIEYDLETDIRFLQGVKAGRESVSLNCIQNLIKETKFSDEKIAYLTDVSIKVVKKIKKEMQNKKK